jgi:hypothetical protein
MSAPLCPFKFCIPHETLKVLHEQGAKSKEVLTCVGSTCALWRSGNNSMHQERGGCGMGKGLQFNDPAPNNDGEPPESEE